MPAAPRTHDDRRPGSTACGPFTLRWWEDGPSDAPLVVLLHGIYAGAHGYEWRALVPELARERRVRVPDLLGAGASDRPDLEYGPEVVLGAVAALIEAAGPEAEVVASSLTGAYALRAVARGLPVAGLTLITPTGLGGAQRSPSGRLAEVAYAVGRHTPLGDVVVAGLSSAPSVRWFQQHQTYADPAQLTEEEVVETRRAARLPNAKHLQLAFVLDRLALPVEPADVAAARPVVLWGSGQGFVRPGEADAWRHAGATVVELPSGLPQVEQPRAVADLILSPPT